MHPRSFRRAQGAVPAGCGVRAHILDWHVLVIHLASMDEHAPSLSLQAAVQPKTPRRAGPAGRGGNSAAVGYG